MLSLAVRILIACLLLLLCACEFGRADEFLRLAQRELRARKYYFGPTDGRESRETTAAIREFQTAKGLDQSGELDEETLRALGLRAVQAIVTADAQALRLGREWVAQFCDACESGDWPREQRFYAEKVRYYYEGEMTRAALRRVREAESARRAPRRQVPVLSYASWNPAQADELWISARIRHELKGSGPTATAMTEELLFVVRQISGEWRLTEVREWPLTRTPKGLP